MPHRRSTALSLIAERGDLVVESDPDRPSGRLLRQAGMEASYIDLANPRHLEFDYLRWIAAVLTAARARRVLHVGGAGCALPRALAAADPQGRQEVWEIDPDVVAFAREWLGLARAPGLRVRVGDGTRALAAAGDDAHHAVVIDAFLGARVAPGPSSTTALGDALRVAGLVLVNVVDDRAGREVSRIASALLEVGDWAWEIAGRSRNTVVVGGRTPRRLDPVRIGAVLARDRSPARIEVLAGGAARALRPRSRAGCGRRRRRRSRARDRGGG